MNALSDQSESAWWAGPDGAAFERELLEHLDEDDAMTVITLIQKAFVPRRTEPAFDEEQR